MDHGRMITLLKHAGALQATGKALDSILRGAGNVGKSIGGAGTRGEIGKRVAQAATIYAGAKGLEAANNAAQRKILETQYRMGMIR